MADALHFGCGRKDPVQERQREVARQAIEKLLTETGHEVDLSEHEDPLEADKEDEGTIPTRRKDPRQRRRTTTMANSFRDPASEATLP